MWPDIVRFFFAHAHFSFRRSSKLKVPFARRQSARAGRVFLMT